MANKSKYNPNIHHRRSIRLKGYDYSQAGLYFITICCQNRACLFGEIVGANYNRPNEDRPEMILNEYGKIAYNEWLKTTEIRNNVELGEFVIMPNHMHGIIRLLDRGELHSPIKDKNNLHSPMIEKNNLHSPITDKNNLHSPIKDKNNLHSPMIEKNNLHLHENTMGECNSPLRGPSNNIGAIVRGYKSSVTKQLNLLNIGCTVWQRNYHEHIIRNEQSYQRISNYIINNPVKWNVDTFFKK